MDKATEVRRNVIMIQGGGDAAEDLSVGPLRVAQPSDPRAG